LQHLALAPWAAAADCGRDSPDRLAVDPAHTGLDAMLFLCLLTSLAGLATGAALAHDFGYQVPGLFPSPADHWDWQALVFTGGLGLLALEVAIRVFGDNIHEP
jgi:hypothetical protein